MKLVFGLSRKKSIGPCYETLISLIYMAIVYFDINYNYTIFGNLSPLTLRIKISLLYIRLVPAMCYVSATAQCKTNEHQRRCRNTSP